MLAQSGISRARNYHAAVLLGAPRRWLRFWLVCCVAFAVMETPARDLELKPDLGPLTRGALAPPPPEPVDLPVELALPPPVEKRRTWRVYKRALQALGALAVSAAVGVPAYRALTSPTLVRVGAVGVGAVREETIGPGAVQSRFAVGIGSRVAGTLERVFVDVGDEVEKGQLLATLERTELDARFRATRGAVATAVQDVNLAKANLAKARADTYVARTRDERARNLVAEGVGSVAEADDMQGAFLAAEASERAAGASVSARQAAVARLADEERVAETILAFTRLESPMAGVITRRALEPGSAVAPGAVVLQLVDADALWVATLVDQSLAGRIRIGQPASIHLRSGTEVPGHVARIAFEADPVTRELEIDVAFDARPARFAIHEEADVTILGDDAWGPTVPLEALKHGPSGSFVYVLANGSAQHRNVRLGLVGAKRALVMEGLSEGESVILSPGALREGQRVAAAKGE